MSGRAEIQDRRAPEASPASGVGRSRTVGWVLEHPVAAVAVVALLARAGFVLVTALGAFDSLVDANGDAAMYHALASDVASGRTRIWSDYDHALYWQTSAFTWPLTWLYQVFGPHRAVGQLLVAVLGSAVAVAAAAHLHRRLGATAALAAGLILALMPSQVLWSSLTMKDAVVWAAGAAIAYCLTDLGRARRRLTLAVVGITVLLLLLGHLRIHSMVLAGLSLVAAAVLGRSLDAVQRGALAVVAAAVPVVVGAGLFGISFVVNERGSLDDHRAANATGRTAIVSDPGSSGAGTRPAQRPSAPATGSSGRSTAPPSAATREARDGDRDPADQELDGHLEHLPTGLVAVLLRPFPWESSSSAAFSLARAEALLWYPLLALAALGAVRGLRRGQRSPTIVFAIAFAGSSLLAQALAEGNLGTAFRHRGEVVWAVVLLAALAAHDRVVRRADA